MKISTKFSLILLLIALPFAMVYAQNAKPKTGTKKKTTSQTPVKKKTTALKPGKEIHWVAGKEPDFEDSVKKWGKPAILYIFLENGDECPAFNKNVLSDTNMINFIDSNFVSYKLNLEWDSPNAMKYMIDDVPCVILFDKKMKEIARQEGYHDAKDTKKFLKKATK